MTLRKDVSDDSFNRIERAWCALGFSGWAEVVATCHNGGVFRVEFAQRRPTDFVKEFAALVRASRLKLAADSQLQLYLGEPSTLAQLLGDARSAAPAIFDLNHLGFVDPKEEPNVVLSAARRSAGIQTEKRGQSSIFAGRTALILDDELVSRKVLSKMFEKESCAVHAVGEAEAAFQTLRNQAPDVVVLDIVLGGTMDGLDFCRVMRSSVEFRKVPVIFVTGHSSETIRADARSMSASAFLEKPVKQAAFRAALLSVTQQPHLAA